MRRMMGHPRVVGLPQIDGPAGPEGCHKVVDGRTGIGGHEFQFTRRLLLVQSCP